MISPCELFIAIHDRLDTWFGLGWSNNRFNETNTFVFYHCLAVFGGWFTSSSTNDSNFLRVANTFTSRRLSDNTLITPKIRVAPSCASSPGGTPGGGLPIRRHSSTGPQERRGSNINLSPPTVYKYIHNLRRIYFSFALCETYRCDTQQM